MRWTQESRTPHGCGNVGRGVSRVGVPGGVRADRGANLPRSVCVASPRLRSRLCTSAQRKQEKKSATGKHRRARASTDFSSLEGSLNKSP